MEKLWEEMTETEKSNSVNNGFKGAYGSGGCMNNPMYRNVCSIGRFEQISGRGKRRLWERRRRKEEKRESSTSKKRHPRGLGNFISK